MFIDFCKRLVLKLKKNLVNFNTVQKINCLLWFIWVLPNSLWQCLREFTKDKLILSCYWRSPYLSYIFFRTVRQPYLSVFESFVLELFMHSDTYILEYVVQDTKLVYCLSCVHLLLLMSFRYIRRNISYCCHLWQLNTFLFWLNNVNSWAFLQNELLIIHFSKYNYGLFWKIHIYRKLFD